MPRGNQNFPPVLKDSGIGFDWVFLVSHICTDKRISDSTNCQTAINAMYLSLDAVEVDKFLVLDQIERVAIELGVYD